MFVLGSEMHLLTFVFLLMELVFFFFQLWYYFAWPKDKSRFWYLILLGLLIIYNLTGGLFPDEQYSWISIRLQNIIAYGSGFIMASYFPFYFYKAFDLKGLRFHAVYGVPLFLLLPYILCFWIFYAWTGDLETAVRYGMVVPFIYSLYLLWAMRKAIQLKSIDLNRNGIYESSLEMNAVYLAVAPWVCMSVFSYFQVSQWLEVLATNLGLIVITILFMLRSVRFERLERERLLALVARNKQDIQDFETSCLAFGLSRREQEIAAPLCAGMTYKQIAASLYISEKTVDAHVRRIFFKTKVNKKIELRQRLGVAI